MIQFVGRRMTWGCNWLLLDYAVLKANPDCHDPKAEPPQELIFYFRAAKVTLLGWRLDLMLDDVARHRLTRIWTLGREAALQNTDTACVSEIFVLPYDDDVWAEHASEEPPTPPEPTQP